MAEATEGWRAERPAGGGVSRSAGGAAPARVASVPEGADLPGSIPRKLRVRPRPLGTCPSEPALGSLESPWRGGRDLAASPSPVPPASSPPARGREHEPRAGEDRADAAPSRSGRGPASPRRRPAGARRRRLVPSQGPGGLGELGRSPRPGWENGEPSGIQSDTRSLGALETGAGDPSEEEGDDVGGLERAAAEAAAAAAAAAGASPRAPRDLSAAGSLRSELTFASTTPPGSLSSASLASGLGDTPALANLQWPLGDGGRAPGSPGGSHPGSASATPTGGRDVGMACLSDEGEGSLEGACRVSRADTEDGGAPEETRRGARPPPRPASSGPAAPPATEPEAPAEGSGTSAEPEAPARASALPKRRRRNPPPGPRQQPTRAPGEGVGEGAVPPARRAPPTTMAAAAAASMAILHPGASNLLQLAVAVSFLSGRALGALRALAAALARAPGWLSGSAPARAARAFWRQAARLAWRPSSLRLALALLGGRWALARLVRAHLWWAGRERAAALRAEMRAAPTYTEWRRAAREMRALRDRAPGRAESRAREVAAREAGTRAVGLHGAAGDLRRLRVAGDPRTLARLLTISIRRNTAACVEACREACADLEVEQPPCVRAYQGEVLASLRFLLDAAGVETRGVGSVSSSANPAGPGPLSLEELPGGDGPVSPAEDSRPPPGATGPTYRADDDRPGAHEGIGPRNSGASRGTEAGPSASPSAIGARKPAPVGGTVEAEAARAALGGPAARTTEPARTSRAAHGAPASPASPPSPSSGKLSQEECLSIFQGLRRALGRTAVAFSGGGSFGYFHFGVLRALASLRCVPLIISGSSAGAIGVGVLATRTPREARALDAVFPEGLEMDVLLNPAGWAQLKYLWETGYTQESKVLVRALRNMFGEKTFGDAYRLSGRTLAISVCPVDYRGPPRLLSHLTAPDVLIYSAVAASSSFPVLFRPHCLLARTPRGDVVPLDPAYPFRLDRSGRGDGGLGDPAPEEGWLGEAVPPGGGGLDVRREGRRRAVVGAGDGPRRSCRPRGSRAVESPEAAEAAAAAAARAYEEATAFASPDPPEEGPAEAPLPHAPSPERPRLEDPMHAADRLGYRRWRDGSLQLDLPLAPLREQFGVARSICSQANPHVAPILELYKHGLWGFAEATIAEFRLRCRQAVELVPWLRRNHVGLYTQPLGGDITVHLNPLIYPLSQASTNLALKDIFTLASEGRQAAFRVAPAVVASCAAEQAVQEGLRRLGQALGGRGEEGNDLFPPGGDGMPGSLAHPAGRGVEESGAAEPTVAGASAALSRATAVGPSEAALLPALGLASEESLTGLGTGGGCLLPPPSHRRPSSSQVATAGDDDAADTPSPWLEQSPSPADEGSPPRRGVLETGRSTPPASPPGDRSLRAPPTPLVPTPGAEPPSSRAASETEATSRRLSWIASLAHAEEELETLGWGSTRVLWETAMDEAEAGSRETLSWVVSGGEATSQTTIMPPTAAEKDAARETWQELGVALEEAGM